MGDKLNMKRKLRTEDMPVWAEGAQRPRRLFRRLQSWQKQKAECLILISLICELCYEYADIAGLAGSYVKPRAMRWSDYHSVLYAIYDAFYVCAEQKHSHMHILLEDALSPFHGGEPRYQFNRMNSIGEHGVFKLHAYNGLGWVDIDVADYRYPVNMPMEFQ